MSEAYRPRAKVHVNLWLDPDKARRIDTWRRSQFIDAKTRAIDALLDIALELEEQRRPAEAGR